MLTNGNILRLYVCLVFLYLHTSFARGYLLEYDKAIIEDAQLKTHELIRKYGLKAEVHKVYTKDGFVLTAHRIPRPGGQPVLLLHGLEDSSATWVMMGPEQGLGYLLFERGYDVWMLNSRGNTYSRKHLRLHPFMSQFWDFSFHEVGIYDLTASIDYVLGKTNFKKLHYIGHSQGTTSFLALGSDRPAYMKKIKAMHALAPPAFFDNLGSPIAKALAPYARSIYFPLLESARTFLFPMTISPS
ncbi:lipase 1 isoform X2 [Scaptodrosophila lebanonensis]|uniref:Lipase 1 isoform X2 n=1 Tax=Drosophila lebanonensis TaxID=7225 RepID=A0A6J2U3X1_DROLE|nr:lipase 1 isoform X2 [Scaptodrosophila lebanonensis]